MSPWIRGERVLTELDHVRLLKFDAVPLQACLDEADIVPSITVPPDVITMYSQFEIEEHEGGVLRKLTLCYPDDAEPAQGFISVLSPLGASLLGLRVGAQARWATPQGAVRTATVRGLLFQPEASGDYTT